VDDVIPLSQPTFGAEEVEAVRSTLQSGWVAGQGPRGGDLENAFRQLTGAEHAVAVSNCTAALHLTLLAFGVGPGDEVVVSDYTYPATGHAVLFTGARPAFVDVRPDTGTMNPGAVEAAITARTKGILAVDVFGQCADYEPLRKLADEHGLFVVEDAAAAVGARYQGQPAGSLAAAACFSLHARKGITSGEGGVIVSDDPRVASSARMLSCFGVKSAYERQDSEDLPVPSFEVLGYNYKLSDIQAAIAVVQVDRLPALREARQRVAARYGELLALIEGIELPEVAEDREHTWQSYVVTLDAGVSRGRVAQQLRQRGIQANIGTFASHLQPVYEDPAPCPVSARLFRRHLAIPMHANLSDADIERVADALSSVVADELR